MLNLKVADLFADLDIKTAKYDAKMRRIKADMAALKGPSLAVSVSTNRVNAAKALIAQLRASAAKPIQVRFAVSPGSSGGVPAIYAWKKAIARGVTIPIGADTKPFFRAVRLIDRWFVRMGRRSTITMDLNTRRADAKARALQKQIQQLKAQAASVRVGMGGGLWGGRGGGGSPGGFGGGVASGLGLALHGSPQMMAGELAGRGLAAAVTTAAGFETTMVRVGQAAGIAGPELARLKDSLLELAASRPGATAGELLGMALVGAKQGVEGVDNLKKFAADMAKVRNAIGDIPVEQLADHMSRMMHTFELGVEHIGGLGSALVKLDNMTVASARDILDIAQRASGPAHRLGYTPEQTMALAAHLRDRGMTNETAGTALSQIMTKMATELDAFAAALAMPTDELKKLLESDPMKAFALVLKKLHEMPSAVDVLGLTESFKIKGTRSKGALLQAADDPTRIRALEEAANRERKTGESLDRMDAAITATTNAKWQVLANEVTTLADAFGQELKPATDGLAEALRLGVGVIGPALKSFAGMLSFYATAFDRDAFRRKVSPETPSPETDPNRAPETGDLAGVVNGAAPGQPGVVASQPKASVADSEMVDAWRAEGVKAGKFYAERLTKAAEAWWAPFQGAIDYEKQARANRLRATIRDLAEVPGNAARMQAGLFRLQAMPALGAIWGGMKGNAAVMREQAGARPTLRSYSSGLDFGRRLQEEILNHKGDEAAKKAAEETAKNTAQIHEGVKSLVGLANRVAGNPFAQAARAVGVLGP